ncbi:phospholipase B1, membrane-associated [Eurytemora carolleeae]|uniref:phospholipase B1, membrane-associated n=1 Tax=Eurytemora carolleeae TaxID=1294199 RepID=UPI000C770FE3|nr:phospholipase B1, membrane-associated [Eurytemora carolleeae]|eukprot:XP_023333087.1 phospholipase B1, membrane-associated-like [Eurytemora affinis]
MPAFAGMEDFLKFFKKAYTVSQSFPSGDGFNTLDQLVRIQDGIPAEYRFPCHTSHRNFYYGQPTDVRFIGPRNIAVVGAIGDSVLAGTGSLARSPLEAYTRYPEQSFAIGGGKTWREYLTIPNILREYNPNLQGYSTGSFGGTGLNFAKPGAMAKNMKYQAKKLMEEMISSKNISFKEDWKLVFVHVGANDLCKYSCVSSSPSVDSFISSLASAVDILYSAPRIIIIILSIPDVSGVQAALQRPLVCQKIMPVLCPCVAGADALPRNQFLQKLSEYRTSMEALSTSARYREREDAAVIFIKTPEYLQIPKDKSLKVQLHPFKNTNLFPDLAYLAPDCFHPSQKLNALAAGMVWEELFTGTPGKQPTGSEDGLGTGQHLFCPSAEQPYFKVKQKQE